MAYKVLGQSSPNATTNTDIYTVPANKSAVVSTIAVANRGAGNVSYRVAVRPAGASIANQHYVIYDVVLTPNSTDYHTVGVTLAATDVVTVYVSAATVSVSVFGDES